MGQKSKHTAINTFERGMYHDSLHSQQPPGTYREAWAVTNKSDNENRYGVSNEASNELWVKLPKDAVIRALIYVEERDWYVVFLRKGNLSEIGIIKEKTKEYTKIVDDNNLPEPMLFSEQEWNSVTAKVMQPCNQLHVYWSNGDYYYRINLEDPCKDWKNRPIKLFREHCVGRIDATIMDGGGGGLPNGIYQAFVRLRDQDGNTTNWFKIGQPIPIGQGYDGDNIEGEYSGKAIQIKTENLHGDYGIADIGIHSTIGGRSATIWVDTVAYGKGILDYYYRGNTGKEQAINLSDVIIRNDLYIRGANLTQYDGHLILYNLRANNNIDWQRDVNNIKAYYQIYAVPLREAHKYKGLMPNENYWFGIHANYVDGTQSADFALIGKDGSNAGTIKLPGCDCEVPVWEVQDTTTRTETFCDLSGFIKDKQREHKLTPFDDNDKVVPEYEPNPAGGKPKVVNNSENANEAEAGDGANKDVNDAIDSSSGKDLKTILCMCEKLREVLIDAEKLSGGDLEKSTRFVGINKKEIYEMACACEAVKDNDGNLVYAPNTFHDLIIKIVE